MAINPAEIIQRRRAELGLSQAQLAERLGRTPSTVRRWERGEAEPPESVVPALASALQVAPRDLAVAFGMKSDEPPPTDVSDLPTEAIAMPEGAPAATTVAAPPQQKRRSPLRRAAALDPAEGLSYIEDNRQRIRYWLRAAMTVVAGIVLLMILFWAFGELREALAEVWDLFGDDAPPPTSPGTDF